MLRSFLIPSLFTMATIVGDATAQRAEGPIVLTVSAKVSGKAYNASGPGSCRHSPDASIYDVPSALWMVEHASPGKAAIKRLNLTLWRPKDGSPDQVSLALETGSSSHRISVGGKSEPVGSATIKLLPLGAGGRFELKGKDDTGTTVEVVITCPAFTGIEAEDG